MGFPAAPNTGGVSTFPVRGLRASGVGWGHSFIIGKGEGVGAQQPPHQVTGSRHGTRHAELTTPLDGAATVGLYWPYGET